MKKISTAGELLELVNSFKISRILLTAFELKLFDHTESNGKTSEEVAAAIHSDPRATDRLLNVLTGTGLLEKHDGRFINSPMASKHLVSTSPGYLGGLGHTNSLWNTWSTLSEVVRSGKMTAEREEINERGTGWLEAFIATMHTRGVAQGIEMAAMLDLSGTRRVLDVGGGSGAFTFGCIAKKPEITGVILDLPNVTPITRKYIERAGLTDRVITMDGDYLVTDFGGDFDLAIMSAIIHINSPEENRHLIAKGAAALNPGGQLVVMDHVMDPSRTEPFVGAVFAINMLVGTRNGDTYTESEIRGWMQEAGLKDIRLQTAPSGMQMMIGVR